MDEAAALAIATERIESLVQTSLDQVLCLEYDPPVPTALAAEDQARRMLESAVIVLCNDAAATPLSGLPPREVIGRRLADVMPHAREALFAQMTAFVRSGYRQHRHVYAFPLRDGGEAWQESNHSGMVVDGNLIRSWTILRDVTEQRNREERLRVSEQRLRSYVEQTIDEVWCWTYEPPLPLDLPADDLAREQPRRAVLADCNHAAAAGIGAKSKEEIIGKTYGELFPASERVPLLLAEEGYAENEISETDATGQTRHFVVRRTQRVVDGCVVQSWATTREVTAAKRASAALFDSERKLQESRKLASLGVLARGIAHDFNTLLAKMIGHVEIARIAAGSDGGASLDAIRDAVARGLDLVEQIESFTLQRERASDAPAAAPPRRSVAPDGGAHILFVDDEPALSRVAAQALTDRGYRVTTYASPLAALDAFRSAPASFDVVVTDQTMPELHGIELAAAISKLRADTPILLISGYAEIIPVESLRSAGVVASLPKPFALEELAASIRVALDARATSGDSVVHAAEDGDRDVIVSPRSTEERAHNELELFRAALRHVGKPLMITATSEDPARRRIVFTNAAFQKMIGRSETELLGASPDILMALERSAYTSMYTEILAGRTFAGEVALARGDGTSFASEFVIAPIVDADRRVTHLVSIHSDVSEMRRVEQQRAELEESVRRTEKMAALGKVAAGVAHQVRNRLFGITATFDAFEARFGSRKDYPAFVSVIREDLNRLTALMRDLLEYGSPQALTVAPGRIDGPIADAVSATTGAAEAAGIAIATRTELAGDDGRLSMDRVRLAQVFSKLLEHAISRSPRGGKVRVLLEKREDGAAIVVRVRDEGAALRPEDVPRAFEPFFFERSAGLGLPIAHGIVERHGGSIAACNVDGGGVEIAVTLPIVAASKERSA